MMNLNMLLLLEFNVTVDNSKKYEILLINSRRYISITNYVPTYMIM